MYKSGSFEGKKSFYFVSAAIQSGLYYAVTIKDNAISRNFCAAKIN
jgi:hypothetical protein